MKTLGRKCFSPMTLLWVAAMVASSSCASLGGEAASTDAARTPKDKARMALSAARGMVDIDIAELRGKLPETRAQLQADASAHPGDKAAQYLALYAAPRDEATWEAFLALSESSPSEAWGSYGMARIYLAWNTFDQAEGELTRARLLEPKSAIGSRLSGELAEKRKRDADAAVHYRQALSLEPGEAASHLGLGRVNLRAGKLTDAEHEALEVLRYAPGHPGALALLAEISRVEKKTTRTETLLNQLVDSAPRDRNARISLAEAKAELGDDRGALVQWREALALGEDAATLRIVATLSHKLGEPVSERQALERLLSGAVDTAPASNPAKVALDWERLAELRLLDKEEEGAEAALQKSVELDPARPESHLRLGRFLAAHGEIGRAVTELRAAGEPGRAERVTLEQRINVDPGLARSPQSVMAVQKAVGRLLDKTYRQRMSTHKKLAGMVKVRVTVDADGKAKSVEMIEDSVHDDSISACARWNLEDAAYTRGKPGRYTFAWNLGAER